MPTNTNFLNEPAPLRHLAIVTITTARKCHFLFSNTASKIKTLKDKLIALGSKLYSKFNIASLHFNHFANTLSTRKTKLERQNPTTFIINYLAQTGKAGARFLAHTPCNACASVDCYKNFYCKATASINLFKQGVT